MSTFAEFWGMHLATGTWTLYTPPDCRGACVLRVTQAALAGRLLHSLTAELNLRTFGDTSL